MHLLKKEGEHPVTTHSVTITSKLCLEISTIEFIMKKKRSES